jgi:single-stranded DNA-binding protein
VNQVVLVGNLTDGALYCTQSGLAVAIFTVTVSRGKRQNGAWQDVSGGPFRLHGVGGTPADNAAASFCKDS